VRFIDLTGKTFGRLTAKSHRVVNKRTMWVCICECGSTAEVEQYSLSRGHTRSCGCYRDEKLIRQSKKHGATVGKDSGKRPPSEYEIWSGIIKRCTNPNSRYYARYGGRGITVCDRWRYDYTAFLADMGPRPSLDHSIDRKDNDGNYEPSNCRWATQREQVWNSNATHLITFNGETLSQSEWARRLGMSHTTVSRRLKSGWPIEKALSLPKQPNGAARIGGGGR